MRRDRLTPLERELLETLEAAESHLDYCGYGDNWERECATSQKLPERIEATLAKARARANDQSVPEVIYG